MYLVTIKHHCGEILKSPVIENLRGSSHFLQRERLMRLTTIARFPFYLFYPRSWKGCTYLAVQISSAKQNLEPLSVRVSEVFLNRIRSP